LKAQNGRIMEDGEWKNNGKRRMGEYWKTENGRIMENGEWKNNGKRRMEE
jgi:hypothetical protein